MSRLEELIAALCPDGVEYKTLGEICIFQKGQPITVTSLSSGSYPVIAGGQKPAFYCSKYNRTGENITVSSSGAYAGYINYWNEPILCTDSFSITSSKNFNIKMLFYILQSKQNYIFSLKKGGGVPHVYAKDMAKIKIPVPPLPVQEEIVRILDKFMELTAELTAELDKRKQQYQYFIDSIVDFSKNKINIFQQVENLITKLCPNGVKHKQLEEVILSLTTGLNPRRFFALNTEDAENYYVTIREIHNKKIIFSDKTDKINDKALRLCNNRSNLEIGDILFSGTGTIGETAIITAPPTNWNIKEGVYSIKPNNTKIISKYLMYILASSSIRNEYMKKAVGGTVKSVPMGELRKLSIPVPALPVQQEIVKILDHFDALCNDLTSGLPAEIEARKKQYEYYRDKLLTFKEKEAD